MSSISVTPPPRQQRNDDDHNEPPRTMELSHRSNDVRIPHTIPLGDRHLSIPPTLFLHGLDSSSSTWKHTLSSLDSPGVAVDLRGCGTSELGDPDDFRPDALVEDLHRFVGAHPSFRSEVGEEGEVRPFVIVGHSMGGRIATAYAATHPRHVLALVIEDMDVRRRPASSNAVRPGCTRDEILSFDRTFGYGKGGVGTAEEGDVVEAFERQGYPEERVRGWIGEGRVHQKEGGGEGGDEYYYYSDVNPAFRLLCYEQFFDSDHGEETWKRIGEICGSGCAEENDGGGVGFPCHVMVAGKEGTVCDEGSISRMKEIFGESSNLVLHRYPDANHSIHNSDGKKYVSDLQDIIHTAALS